MNEIHHEYVYITSSLLRDGLRVELWWVQIPSEPWFSRLEHCLSNEPIAAPLRRFQRSLGTVHNGADIRFFRGSSLRDEIRMDQSGCAVGINHVFYMIHR